MVWSKIHAIKLQKLICSVEIRLLEEIQRNGGGKKYQYYNIHVSVTIKYRKA